MSTWKGTLISTKRKKKESETSTIQRALNARAVEEGGSGGLSPPSTISRGAEPPLYFLQTIYSSVKGSISKIKSPENRQLFMLIY